MDKPSLYKKGHEFVRYLWPDLVMCDYRLRDHLKFELSVAHFWRGRWWRPCRMSLLTITLRFTSDDHDAEGLRQTAEYYLCNFLKETGRPPRTLYTIKFVRGRMT